MFNRDMYDKNDTHNSSTPLLNNKPYTFVVYYLINISLIIVMILI